MNIKANQQTDENIGELSISDDYIETGSLNTSNTDAPKAEEPKKDNDSAPKPDKNDILSILDGGESETDAEDAENDASQDGADTENEGDTGDENAESENANKPKKNRAQERIRKLAAEKSESERLLAEARAKIQILEAEQLTQTQRQDIELVAPDPENFEYGMFDPRYQTELASYNFKVLQAEKESQEISAAERQRQQEIQKAEIIQKELIRNRVSQVMSEGESLYSDFKESVMSDKYAFTEVMGDALINCENAAEIAYRLSKNPNHASQLANLPAPQQVREIFRLDFELSRRKTAAKATKAPPPPLSNRGGVASGKTAAIRPDTEKLDDFERIFFKK